MEEIVERENLKEALRRVKANKGSTGVDGMTVNQLGDYLKQHWPAIRERLLSGASSSSRRSCRFFNSGGTRGFQITGTRSAHRAVAQSSGILLQAISGQFDRVVDVGQ